MFCYTVKNVKDIPVPSRAGIIKLFPPRESLVSDIPAGDGNITNLFYSVQYLADSDFSRWNLSVLMSVRCSFISLLRRFILLTRDCFSLSILSSNTFIKIRRLFLDIKIPYCYKKNDQLSPNFETFKEHKNQIQGNNSASLCSQMGRYDNLIPTRFLASIIVKKFQHWNGILEQSMRLGSE
jgi:hypothetical protein